MPRVCVNSAYNFCYICGKFIVSLQKRVLTTRKRKVCHYYFGCKVGDQDKASAPHICCNSCVTALNEWLKKKRKAMPFAVPMIWREPTDYVDNCYFCLTPSMKKGFNRKKKSLIEIRLELECLVLKQTLTQYYKQNLFKQNLLISHKTHLCPRAAV